MLRSRGVLGGRDGIQAVSRVTRLFQQIQRITEDGPFMDNPLHGTYLRSDVLAQLVRIGSLLKLGGCLGQEGMVYIKYILDYAIDAFVADGRVCFFEKERPDNFYNTWCAMFLCQAISLYQIASSSEPFADAEVNRICQRVF